VHATGEFVAPDGPALARFAQLLEKRACSYWQENELAQVLPVRATKPDFFVSTPSKLQLLVEIESFEKERLALLALRQNSVMSGLAYRDQRRVATAVQHASKQLKPYRDLGFPSLVVLDDFRHVGMPTNADILGLFLLEYFDPKRDRGHISAVAWLVDGEELSPYLRVFHNPYAATALPREAFGAQVDEHWSLLPGQFWKRRI
jgi:hypothetical protein